MRPFIFNVPVYIHTDCNSYYSFTFRVILPIYTETHKLSRPLLSLVNYTKILRKKGVAAPYIRTNHHEAEKKNFSEQFFQKPIKQRNKFKLNSRVYINFQFHDIIRRSQLRELHQLAVSREFQSGKKSPRGNVGGDKEKKNGL